MLSSCCSFSTLGWARSASCSKRAISRARCDFSKDCEGKAKIEPRKLSMTDEAILPVWDRLFYSKPYMLGGFLLFGRLNCLIPQPFSATTCSKGNPQQARQLDTTAKGCDYGTKRILSTSSTEDNQKSPRVTRARTDKFCCRGHGHGNLVTDKFKARASTKQTGKTDFRGFSSFVPFAGRK